MVIKSMLIIQILFSIQQAFSQESVSKPEISKIINILQSDVVPGVSCTESTEDDECDLSFEKICKDFQSDLMDANIVSDEIKKPIFDELLTSMSDAAGRYGINSFEQEKSFSTSFGPIHGGSAAIPNSGAAWVATYQEKIYKHALSSEKLKDPWPEVQDIFKKAKQGQIDVVKNYPGLSQKVKERLVSRIEKIELVNPFDLMKDTTVLENPVNYSTSMCGADGQKSSIHFIDGEFGVDGKIKKNKLPHSLIYLCPGDLVKFARKQNQPFAVGQLGLIISHEIGHSQYPTDIAKEYKGMISCLDTLTKEEVPSERIPLLRAGMIQENIADYWGIENTSSLLNQSNQDIKEKRLLAKNILKQFCGNKNSSIKSNFTHTAWIDRININLSRNKSLLEALQCSNHSASKKTSCNFK